MEINREVLRSSGRIKRRRALHAVSLLGFLIFALIILTNYILHLDGLYIQKIYINGNKQVEDNRIFSLTKEILAGKYYGMYPKSNVLIYPKGLVAQTLLRNIPWLASVSISSNTKSLLIFVEEREPKYLWCDDFNKPILERTCYYMDRDGLVFDKAPSFSGHIYPEFYGGNKRGGYLGRSILPTDTLNAVLEIKNSADKMTRDKKYSFGALYGIYVNNNGDYDLLFDQGTRGWKVIFDMNTDPVKKLRAVLDSPFFQKELANTDKRLEYIDLRFGKKVFYKFIQRPA